jgi:hypothetical protein
MGEHFRTKGSLPLQEVLQTQPVQVYGNVGVAQPVSVYFPAPQPVTIPEPVSVYFASPQPVTIPEPVSVYGTVSTTIPQPLQVYGNVGVA